MTNERALAGLAHYLKEKADARGDIITYPEIAGFPVTFPYHEVEAQILSASYRFPLSFSDEGMTAYLTMKDLFTPENTPPHWQGLIQEIGVLREKNGCCQPINLMRQSEF